jgi:Integrase core domain
MSTTDSVQIGHCISLIPFLYTVSIFWICDSFWAPRLRRRAVVLHTEPTVSARLRSDDVLHCLTELFVAHGPPEHIRSDNGPEFVARNVREWLGRIGVKTLYIEPGKGRDFISRVPSCVPTTTGSAPCSIR